jgi:Protein of unknown function (DUF2778)
MSWTFEIATGNLLDPDGALLATGYSGNGIGRNNVSYQATADVGPIPIGVYGIGPPEDSAQLGPHAMPLTPSPANEMYGRFGFFIHGDNSTHTASEGCVILSFAARQVISASGDNNLQVVSGLLSVSDPELGM